MQKGQSCRTSWFHYGLSEAGGDQLNITAPFLLLPEKGRIPLLRQVAALNLTELTLACISLQNDKLFFDFHCPVALCNPYKIYYVLEEICRIGDKYDDEFVTKFKAERIYEPKITPYDNETVDKYTKPSSRAVRNVWTL